MSHPEHADLARLIQALGDGGVEFIVVGGAAAVLHGAPITTRDLDIVHRRTPENVDDSWRSSRSSTRSSAIPRGAASSPSGTRWRARDSSS